MSIQLVSEVILLIVACLGSGALALGVVFLLSSTAYGRVHKMHARSLIKDWEMQLELLDRDDRLAARHTPPPDIVAALALSGR